MKSIQNTLIGIYKYLKNAVEYKRVIFKYKCTI